MYIVNPDLDNYMRDILPDRDPVLLEMEQYACDHRFPIVGPLVGTFLCQMAAAIKARSIFEMGSGFGYSSYWFSKGLPDGGRIVCTDGDEENLAMARAFHDRGGFSNEFEYHVGDAREIIQRHDGPFDIVFNDIDKEQYPDAFRLAIPRLRKGGLFITDNVLWSGRILDSIPSKSTRGILEFNRLLFDAPDMIASIIPIRDGLALAVKR
jgi:predicted O-methyltransferase YrrM